MKFFIKLLALASIRFPKTFLFFAFTLAILSLFFASQRLVFDTNQDNLISPDQKYFQDYQKFLKEFGDWEYFYVVIEVPQNQQQMAKSFAKKLVSSLQENKNLFAEIFYKIPTQLLRENALLLLPQNDFDQLIKTTENYHKEIGSFLQVNSLTQWYQLVNHLLTSKIQTTNEETLEKIWPHFISSLLAPFQQTQLHQLEKTNFFELFSNDYFDEEGFLFTKNGKLLILKILPSKNFNSLEIVKEPLQALRHKIKNLNKEFPQLHVGVTGKPVLQNDEAEITSKDSEYAGIASFIGVLILFGFFFKSFKRSFFALLSLFVGISWTTGFIVLFFGKINLLTLSFATILVGLGIDYAIHFLVRYQTNLLKNSNKNLAIQTTLEHSGIPILLGAVTSALAFLTALFTDFLGLQELGIITGAGIILCALAQLTVFPSLLQIWDVSKNEKDKIPNFRKLIGVLRFPKITVAFFVVFTLLCLTIIPKTQFEHNLLKLQYQNLESIKYEKVIQEKSDESTWFLVYVTKDWQDLINKNQLFKNLPTVKKTESLLDYIPLDADKKIATLQNTQQLIFQKSNKIAEASSSLKNEIENLQKNFEKLANQALKNGRVDDVDALLDVAEKINQLKNQSPTQEQDFLKFISQKQDVVKKSLQPVHYTEQDLPAELLKLYKSPEGSYALTIYPKHDIWEQHHMEEFIQEIRRITPNITGAPITTYESAKLMIQGFELVAVLTSSVILILLFLHFRKIQDTLLIFSNLLMSLLWLVLAMFVFDLKINLANFFALPVLIGTGIDHAIHIIDQFKKNQCVEDLFDSIIPAVFLSCMTTILGFGALGFVRHQGLASFGQIMALGTFFVLMSSTVILPNYLKLKTSSV